MREHVLWGAERDVREAAMVCCGRANIPPFQVHGPYFMCCMRSMGSVMPEVA